MLDINYNFKRTCIGAVLVEIDLDLAIFKDKPSARHSEILFPLYCPPFFYLIDLLRDIKDIKDIKDIVVIKVIRDINVTKDK